MKKAIGARVWASPELLIVSNIVADIAVCFIVCPKSSLSNVMLPCPVVVNIHTVIVPCLLSFACPAVSKIVTDILSCLISSAIEVQAHRYSVL